MKISVLKKEVWSYNASTHFYDINSGLQSLTIKSKNEKQTGFIRLTGYPWKHLQSKRQCPKKVPERYFLYFTITITSSKTSAAINMYIHQNLLALYRTKKHWFKAPNSLLEYFTLYLNTKTNQQNKRIFPIQTATEIF